MSVENARIECLAKPITHAFINFKSDDERKQVCQISEHVEKRVERKEDKDDFINRRRRKIPSEKNGYVKYCIHMRHNSPLNSIFMHWTSKHVSVKGQIVVKTCQNESLKHIKYQDIETEVEFKWKNGN